MEFNWTAHFILYMRGYDYARGFNTGCVAMTELFMNQGFFVGEMK